MRKPLPKNNGSGFTLIEILVAVTLMAITFTVISQLFSGSLRLAGMSGHYNKAASLADQVMGRALSSNEPQGGDSYSESGQALDRYTWEVTISPYEDFEPEDEQSSPMLLFDVTVNVSWTEGARSRVVELHGIKSISRSSKVS